MRLSSANWTSFVTCGLFAAAATLCLAQAPYPQAQYPPQQNPNQSQYPQQQYPNQSQYPPQQYPNGQYPPQGQYPAGQYPQYPPQQQYPHTAAAAAATTNRSTGLPDRALPGCSAGTSSDGLYVLGPDCPTRQAGRCNTSICGEIKSPQQSMLIVFRSIKV